MTRIKAISRCPGNKYAIFLPGKRAMSNRTDRRHADTDSQSFRPRYRKGNASISAVNPHGKRSGFLRLLIATAIYGALAILSLPEG